MKSLFYSLALSLAIVTVSFAQLRGWYPVKTLTGGNYDDGQPSLNHNAFFIPAWPYNSQWMVFQRRAETISMIAARKLLFSDLDEDTSVVIIATAPAGDEVALPDIASTRYYTGGPASYSKVRHVAVWQRRSGGMSSVEYSECDDTSGTWSTPSILAADTIDNHRPQIRQSVGDSSFVVAWLHGSTLRYLLLSPSGPAEPVTVATSSLDSVEFDFNTQYERPFFAWTDIDSTGKHLLLCADYRIHTTGSSVPSDTVCFPGDVYNPRLPTGWFGEQQILFESPVGSRRDIFIWSEGFWPVDSAFNLTNDTTSDDKNPCSLLYPMTTAPERWLPKLNPYFLENLVYERWVGTEQALIFSCAGGTDTLMNQFPYYDRNAAFGSLVFPSLTNDLKAVVLWESNRSGRSHIYGRLVGLPLGAVKDEAVVAATFSLSQNYPNPFNPSTQIRFSLASPSHVTLRINDILGRTVATLLNERVGSGDHEVTWDAHAFPSGPYFCVAHVDGRTEVRRMMLLR